MESIRFFGTKQSLEDVWITLRWSRVKHAYFLYSVIGAGVLSGTLLLCVKDSEWYSGGFIFFIVFFLLWKGMPGVSRQCAKIEVQRIWKKFPDEKMYVNLDDKDGLKKGFLNSMYIDESNEQVILTKVETVDGHSVIFCNVGKQKNQVWFVADQDSTEFLSSWLAARGFLTDES